MLKLSKTQHKDLFLSNISYVSTLAQSALPPARQTDETGHTKQDAYKAQVSKARWKSLPCCLLPDAGYGKMTEGGEEKEF
jgi:hypothetical protein